MRCRARRTPITGRKAAALVAFGARAARTFRARKRFLPGFQARSSRGPCKPARCARETRRRRARRAERAAESRRRAAAHDRAARRAGSDRRVARRAALSRRRCCHGVTGSGKTYVYVEAIDARGARRRPRDRARSGDLADAADGARFERGVRAIASRCCTRRSPSASVSKRGRPACAARSTSSVGARSAVFAPLRGVRLLVVDEAHESVVQAGDGSPRYHAVAVARERMRRERRRARAGQRDAVAGELCRGEAGRIELLEMRERATAQPHARRARRGPGRGVRSGQSRAIFQQPSGAGDRRAAGTRREERAAS